MTVHNCGIVSQIRLRCANEECEFVYELPIPAKTTMHADGKKYERSTDYELNLVFVLGNLANGNGGVEAGKLLGLMGLPNDTTMSGRTFPTIERRIGPILRELRDEILMENLDEEVRRSTTEEHYLAWKLSLPEQHKDHPVKIKLKGSYDGAWQQKGSGLLYNSSSGHGSLVGAMTRQVIAFGQKSKKCGKCEKHEKDHPDADTRPDYPEHYCPRNHDPTDSSGAMEAALALEIVIDLYDNKGIIVELLCCDDNSSIRADLKWSNKDYLINNNTTVLPQVPKTKGKNKGELQDRPDKGKLSGHIPEPKFCADPNHRRKQLTGELIRLDLAKVADKKTMTRLDSIRLGKNYGYMARTLKDRDESEFVDVVWACLEHHFDSHDKCGDWCARCKATQEEQAASKKYYRDKKEDAELYELLKKKMGRYCELERLREIAHGLDTNANESFNSVCTWFAPKNKVFSGSCSLANRLAFAVGIVSLGYVEFFNRLFLKLGIDMTNNVQHYLSVRQNARQKRLDRLKTPEYKQYRAEKKNERIRLETIATKKAWAKRHKCYRPGMNLDLPQEQLPDEAARIDAENAAKRPAKKRKTTKTTTSKGRFCPFCGKKGHVSTKSKKCTKTGDSKAAAEYDRLSGKLISELAASTPIAASIPAASASSQAASIPEAEIEEEVSPEETAHNLARMVEDGTKDLADLECIPFDALDGDNEEDNVGALDDDDDSDAGSNAI